MQLRPRPQAATVAADRYSIRNSLSRIACQVNPGVRVDFDNRAGRRLLQGLLEFISLRHLHKAAGWSYARTVGRGERPEFRIIEIALPKHKRGPISAAIILHFHHQTAVCRQDDAVTIEHKGLLLQAPDIVRLNLERRLIRNADQSLLVE